MLTTLSIQIALDPYITSLGGVTISWLGVFIVLGIFLGSWLAFRLAFTSRVNLDPDQAYNLLPVVVASGIVGARLLFVVERYGDSSSLDSPLEIFAITEGGISIYGSLIGGAVGGWAYGLWKRLPCAATADAAAMGMLLGIAVGRVGDVINGEHLSRLSNLPWAVTYTHPNSPSYMQGTQHPVVAYEIVGALAILGLLFLLLQRSPKPGVVFALAFLGYAVMRFFISFLRVDSKEALIGLSTPQVVSILVFLVALSLLIYFVRRPPAQSPQAGPSRSAMRFSEDQESLQRDSTSSLSKSQASGRQAEGPREGASC